MRKLTPLQQAFIEQYLLAPQNQAEAFRKACLQIGYPLPKSLKRSAYQAYNKPGVRAEIERRQAAMTQKANLTLERIVNGILAEIEAPDATPQSRLMAWKLLGDHLGIWKKGKEAEAPTNNYVLVLPQGPMPKDVDEWQQRFLPSLK